MSGKKKKILSVRIQEERGRVGGGEEKRKIVVQFFM